jgi:DNA-binding NarL/FixJ family response regulator
MKNTIRIAMIEDTPDVRDNLRTIIATAPDMRLLHEFSTAEDARDRLPTLSVDVLIVDVNLPGISGIDFLRQCSATLPHTQCMMYTVHDDDARVFEALKAGANGYLLKRSSPQQLLDALRELHEGGSPMSASVARRLVQHFRPSDRERDVLSLLAEGLLYKEIADKLHIATKTVKNHIHTIYEKLHVQNRTEAVNRWYGR